MTRTDVLSQYSQRRCYAVLFDENFGFDNIADALADMLRRPGHRLAKYARRRESSAVQRAWDRCPLRHQSRHRATRVCG